MPSLFENTWRGESKSAQSPFFCQYSDPNVKSSVSQQRWNSGNLLSSTWSLPCGVPCSRQVLAIGLSVSLSWEILPKHSIYDYLHSYSMYSLFVLPYFYTCVSVSIIWVFLSGYYLFQTFRSAYHNCMINPWFRRYIIQGILYPKCLSSIAWGPFW